MVSEEMCVGPFICRARTGECCEVLVENARLVCPLGCTDDTRRQSDVAGSQRFSLRDIFGTTLVTTFMYQVLTNIGATTTSTPTTISTTTTTTTTTTAPTITPSIHTWSVLVNVVSISILVTGTSGTFYSVNYPSNYFDNYEEQYSINVENGFKISLYFEIFDLEHHVGCIYDYIEGKMLVISHRFANLCPYKNFHDV